MLRWQFVTFVRKDIISLSVQSWDHENIGHCPQCLSESWYIKTHSSICLLTCHKSFNLTHNFWNSHDCSSISGMHDPSIWHHAVTLSFVMFQGQICWRAGTQFFLICVSNFRWRPLNFHVRSQGHFHYLSTCSQLMTSSFAVRSITLCMNLQEADA